MGGDYTRFTNKPEKRYSGVLMQQGRVQLDADWNEEVEIIKRRWELQAKDTFGPCAVPKITTPGAFKVTRIDGDPLDLKIGGGRIYVDGLLVEALNKDKPAPDKPISYLHQPFYPMPPKLPKEGNAIVYLDVWEREVTYIEDPDLLEKALGGPDTTTRTQTVWQVKVKVTEKPVTCGMKLAPLSLSPSGGRLSTRAISPPASDDPCTLSPSGGYRGLENRLYRVEIHHGGGLPRFLRPRPPKIVVPVGFVGKAQVAIVPETVHHHTWMVGQAVELFSQRTEDEREVPTFARIKAVDARRNMITLDKDISSLANDVNIQMCPIATFKWSRENASVVSSVHEIKISGSQTVLKVSRIGRDKILRFDVDDWVEVTDDYRELMGLPGETARITKPPDETNLTITLDRAIPSPGNLAFGADEKEIRARHTRLRRWDQQLNVDTDGLLPVSNDWIKLEDGVEVKFDLKEDGIFHVGDYWTFAARTADASVEPLDQEPPRGIIHHFCQLAAWHDVVNGEPEDCRTLWPPECGKGDGCCTVIVNPGESIQAAIDALPESGGFICLKTGIHTIEEPIQIKRSNVILHGESPGTKVVRTDGINMLIISAVSDVMIEGIKFVFKHSRKPLAQPKTSSVPIVIPAIMILNACEKATVKGCSLGVESDETVPVIGLWIERSIETTIEGNHIYSVMGGVRVFGGKGLGISQNKIEGPVHKRNSTIIAAGKTGIEILPDQRAGGFDFGQISLGRIPNPYVWASVSFLAPGQKENRIIDQYPPSPNQDGKGELDLQREMVVTGFLPSYEVKAKVVQYYSKDNVTMEAYKGSQLVGQKKAGPVEGQLYELVVEGEEIDRVVFRSPSNEALLLHFAYSFIWGTTKEIRIDQNRIENFWVGVSLAKAVETCVVSGNEITCSLAGMTGNEKLCGIEVFGRNCLVKENHLENYWIGVSVAKWAERSTIARNEILRAAIRKESKDRKLYGIDVSAPHCIIEENYLNLMEPSHGGIRVTGGHNSVEGNELQSEVKKAGDQFPLGIYLGFDQGTSDLPPDHCVIRGNRLFGLQDAIKVDGGLIGARGLQILENQMTGIEKEGGTRGLSLQTVYEAMIVDNWISRFGFGIVMNRGYENEVLRNKLMNGGLGILGWNIYSLTISQNNIEDMKYAGIVAGACPTIKMVQNRLDWCGYVPVDWGPSLPSSIAIGLTLPTDVSIESCELLHTGVSPDRKNNSSEGTAGIFSLGGEKLFVHANRILGGGIKELNVNKEHSAITLLGTPVEFSPAKKKVEISDNIITGLGFPNLVCLPPTWKIEDKPYNVKFTNLIFSHNLCEQMTVRSGSNTRKGTILLAGDYLSVVGNQIMAKQREYHSFWFELEKEAYLTAVSNVTSGEWVIADGIVKPTPYKDFNHVGALAP